MNKKNLALKLLLNPRVRRFVFELLKNPRIRHFIVGQLTRQLRRRYR